jgi:hypothetical protein
VAAAAAEFFRSVLREVVITFLPGIPSFAADFYLFLTRVFGEGFGMSTTELSGKDHSVCRAKL